ncbi:MAG: hypothetical protein ACHP84_19675 [Caulobacterales bacterium]
MKITLVTDMHGALVGTIRGHALSEKKDGVEAGVMVGPGYSLHHVDVDEGLAAIKDAAELHHKLAAHVPSRT